MRDDAYVLARIAALRSQNSVYSADKWRIRNIMNGGADGIVAIMAWGSSPDDTKKMAASIGSDLPAVNMMASGVERLGQRIGVAPTLKMPYGPRDSQTARDKAEVRERLIESWDDMSGLELQYPQLGRWLPGYGFCAWVLRPRKDPVTRQLWPHIELRDPFDTWPGYFGAGQQPVEVCFRRSVPKEALAAAYPEINWEAKFRAKRNNSDRGQTSGAGTTADSWEGSSGGTQIIEYYDQTGCYVSAPEFDLIIDRYPNQLTSGPQFYVAKRISFDRLLSQYHHVVGLVGMQAKLNMLALIHTEDTTFRETNIFGDMESNVYQYGRDAQNYFEANARVEKPTGGSNLEIFQQIDRITAQLRIGAAYDAGSDSIAARGGFITGKGMEELRDPMDRNVNEYQKVIRRGVEALDTRRLEWEEVTERSKRKRVFWLEGDRATTETYVPAVDIGGNWRSSRKYGMMATWDENSKIVAGLQLLQGGIIDVQTLQQNLDGLDELNQINQRMDRDSAKRDLQEALRFMASQGDPRAAMALVEILDKPQDTLEILKKFFTPAEPQMSPAEEAMAQVPGGGGTDLGIGGPPPDVQTVLSRLTGGGQAEGGVQTVGTNVG